MTVKPGSDVNVMSTGERNVRKKSTVILPVLCGLRTTVAVVVEAGAVRLVVTVNIAPAGAELCGSEIVPLMPVMALAIGIVIEIGAPLIGVVVVSFPTGDMPDVAGCVGMLDIEPPPLQAAKLAVRSNKLNEM